MSIAMEEEMICYKSDEGTDSSEGTYIIDECK